MKKTILLLVLIMYVSNVLAQTALPSFPISPPQIIPTTPEAATLIRNIQFPVSYAHGTVDISIPLYEITVGDVHIPIFISYNHKGTRPMEYSHYLGQGWTLNAEPMISRKTNGKPDKNCKYTKFDDHNPTKYDKEFLVDPDSDMDAYPDEYYFRIPGKSGAFIFKNRTPSSNLSYQVATIPYEPIKVAYSPRTSLSDGTFTIIDDNGIEYDFGAVETTQTFYGKYLSYYYLDSSWKCSKITNPKGNIEFSYTDTTSKVTSLNKYAVIEDYIPGIIGNLPPFDLPLIQQYDHSTVPEPYYYNFNIIETPTHNSGYYLYDYKFMQGSQVMDIFKRMYSPHNVNNKIINSITFPQGSVEFSNSSNGALSTIVVRDGSGNVVRTITFTHSLTSEDYPVLDALAIVGGGIDEKYKFDYYGDLPLAIDESEDAFRTHHSVPVNFWGYQGLGSDNFSWIDINHRKRPGSNDFISNTFGINMGLRLTPASSAGILKSISTKSGAVTEFEYESDRFLNIVQTGDAEEEKVVNSGGLRIKTIKQYDHINSSPVERHFVYGLNESGLGYARINMELKFFTSTKIIHAYDEYDAPFGKWRQRIIGSSINGADTFSGVPIVYDEVTEYIKANGMSYGKVIYNYNYWSLARSYHMFLDSSILYDNKIFDWSMGDMTSKQTYRYNSATNNYYPVHGVNYVYSSVQNQIDRVDAGQAFISEITHRETPSWDNESEDVIQYVTHQIIPGAMLLKSSTETSYDDNGIAAMSSITDYRYNVDFVGRKHLNPTAVTVTNSDGTVYSREIKYPQDVTSGRTDQSVINFMISENILNPIIEQTYMANDIAISTTYNYYKIFNLLPLLQKQTIKNCDGVVEDRIMYKNYDIYGNPIFITKDDTTNVVYLWGGKGHYLVAMIENATESQVKSALSGVTLNASEITESHLNTLRNNSANLKDAFITTFKYKPLIGIVEITGPNGTVTTYDYDHPTGRLISVRDDKGYYINRYSYGLKGIN